jgi:protein TonB
MELQSILQANYLDIIFDNRNKSYGGYELRKHYNQRAIKAVLLVFSLLLLGIGIYSFASRLKPMELATNTRQIPTVLSNIPIEIPKPKLEIPQPKPAAAPLAKPTVANPPPVITHDNMVDKTPPSTADLKDKVPGTVDAKGDLNGIAPATTKIPGTGTIPTSIIEPPAAINKIETYVDQMPEFNGDISKYLSSNINYPELAKETNIEGRVTIKFVVNEDGSISDARIIRKIGGGCEEEALRVVNSMPKWKPGKKNGVAVKVYCTLPVSFVLK